MGAVPGYLADHWRGRLPLWQALVGPVLAGHLAARAGLAVLPSGPWVWGGIGVVALLLVWQVVGTLRAIDGHMRAGGSGEVAGYAALLALLAMNGVAVADRAIGPARPDLTPAGPRPPSNISIDGDRLILSGEVTLESYFRAEVLLAARPGISVVELDSPGGAVHGARGLARLVAQAGLETRVTGRRWSACPLVFLAGARRTMAEEGRLGFHNYAFGGHDQISGRLLWDAEDEVARDRAYYLGRGIAGDFVARIFETPHDGIWEPDRATLIEAGVLTR